MITPILEMMHSEKKGWRRQALRAVATCLSWPFRGVVAIRNAAYDVCDGFGRSIGFRYFRCKKYCSKANVISIGNIVAGGTGKTPFTIFLAEKILKKKSLAILSRGYKSKFESSTFGPQQVSCGNGPMMPASQCGDEPYLISQRVPKALFFVGKNRVEGARMAVQEKVRTVILDDGMQYRKLHRNVEIVIVDAQDPFGKGHFLPRGFLRDHPKSLKRADLIVVNHAKLDGLKKLKLQLEKYSNTPIVAMHPKYLRTTSLKGDVQYALHEHRVAAFCGIAKPHHFYHLLERQGANLVVQSALKDHQKASLSYLKAFAKQAQEKGASLVVCTEKDAVKLSKNLSLDLPVAYVQMDLEVINGQEHLDHLLNEIV